MWSEMSNSTPSNVPCELPGTCALVGKPVRRDCGCVGHGCINASESVNVIEKATCSTPDRWNKIKENIRIDEGLSDEQRQAVLAILRKHQDTGGASPSRQAPRRMGPQQKRKVEEIINDMQEGDLIRPSKSPWSSSIVLVKKKSGETRFCIDYRQVNAKTKKNSFPVPRIDDSLDELAGCEYFSTLDLKSGYWQIPMDEASREATAFTSHVGLFEFNVMPMGLCNSAASFQRLMRIVLHGVEWKGVLAYLDDVIVYGRSFEEHLERLKLVFERIKAAGLTLKPTKCTLFNAEVHFLGHVVSRRGVKCDPNKTKAVVEWPIPRCVKHVRQFVGLTSYYRKFIKNYANIAAPLHKLTEKGKKFSWTKECQTAFENLKGALVSSPVLRYPDFNNSFILDTDASDLVIGCVLSQNVSGGEHVVAYGSRSLSKSERNYSTTRKELLAIVYASKLFRCYLLGNKFLLRTDHSSLRWLWRSKEMYGQCARWVEHLSAYEFELVHRVGNKHQNADALSRVELEETPADFPYVVQDPGKNITTVTNVLHTIELREALGYSVGEIKAAQEADEDISPLFRWLEKGVRPNYRSVKKLSAVLRHYWSVFGKLSQRNGILYYRDENCTQPGESVYRLILPAKLRLKVLRNLHDERVGGGHLGIAKTSSKIRNRFYWARWRREVEDYCRRCLGCEFNKKPSKSSRAELIPSNECRPLERIEVDVLGPLPMSHTGFQYILVACDVYTKYVRAWPMRHQSAKETAGLLFHRWFMVHGVPETVHSDQGRNFESTLFKELLALMGANKTRSSPYHPSGNGGVERNNRTIVAMLRNYVQKDERNWDQVLSAVVAAYNASAHDSTGLSPHYLLTGRMLRLPADLQGKNVATELSLETEMDALRDRLLLADQVTDEVLGEQRAKMKTHHDKQCHGKEISVGDRVLLDNPAVPVDRCRKFHLPYKGPYKVAKKVGQVNYQVEDDHGKKQTVHYNRLKRVSKDVNRLEESVESQEGNNAPIRESQAR
ncbi:unnamed protein product [Clavelina lepadiformis]|uniref:Gypsy retrotransposon integrase-like protein 1 n=1 Tax=Clavelina lepadiformis TaxID=159417 RepID=A0ABP0GNM7_CLALP